jgi:hypothetical protein
LMTVILSAKPLAATISRAVCAMSLHSTAYTCFAPVCAPRRAQRAGGARSHAAHEARLCCKERQNAGAAADVKHDLVLEQELVLRRRRAAAVSAMRVSRRQRGGGGAALRARCKWLVGTSWCARCPSASPRVCLRAFAPPVSAAERAAGDARRLPCAAAARAAASIPLLRARPPHRSGRMSRSSNPRWCACRAPQRWRAQRRRQRPSSPLPRQTPRAPTAPPDGACPCSSAALAAGTTRRAEAGASARRGLLRRVTSRSRPYGCRTMPAPAPKPRTVAMQRGG